MTLASSSVYCFPAKDKKKAYRLARWVERITKNCKRPTKAFVSLVNVNVSPGDPSHVWSEWQVVLHPWPNYYD